jgi:hypothetical protein
MENGELKMDNAEPENHFPFSILHSPFLSCLCILAVTLLVFTSCGSKPTDVRTVMPGDAQVYLESQDVGKALRAVTEHEAFRKTAKTTPDLSALDGVRLAIAVTGFKKEDEQAGEQHVVGKVIPQFVAAAETNAWNYQAIGFTENKLGEFINDIYGGGVQLERFPRHEGDYFVWTAQDGRKAYGLVIGSLVFFGNDESAIEKCVAVRKGEGDSFAKVGKLPAGDHLASGYVSPEGVGQISNIAAVQLAIGSGEEEESRRFIAAVLPEIVRNSISEVTWTASKTETGMVDRHLLTLNPEIAQVLNETMSPASGASGELAAFLPNNAASVTQYSLKDPQIAWRSVLASLQKLTDPMRGQLIGTFADSLFEPYAVEASEPFFQSVGPEIFTATFDEEGEDAVVIATIKDVNKLKTSVIKEIDLSKAPVSEFNAEIWRSEDGTQAVAISGNVVILGHADGVIECLKARTEQQGAARYPLQFTSGRSVSKTFDYDPEGIVSVVQVMADKKDGEQAPASVYLTETRFTPAGIEREVASEFGLIGTIIEQFAKEQ